VGPLDVENAFPGAAKRSTLGTVRAVTRIADAFPYGRAPFWLLLLAVSSFVAVTIGGLRRRAASPDLVLVTFAKNHLDAYRDVIPDFEREHGVEVDLQLVYSRALETRLQNALLAGTPVPDLVEIGALQISYFTRGPLEDVGFFDLTDRLEREGYRQRLVESRLSLYSSRKRVFAVPHDVHPVMLLYRADIVESLGIDVETLDTWAEFARVGREVTKDLDGDGVVDRFMIDLPVAGAWALHLLLLQRGVSLFDEDGNVNFNQPLTIDTMLWLLRNVHGPERIAFECGFGQPFLKAMSDGLVLFYIAPDWRTYATEIEAPRLSGKLKVMPMPAWHEGGRRTSVWGGTGLGITRSTQHPELAWELAKRLYFEPSELGRRFRFSKILPPLRDAWELPEFQEPSAYFSGQKMGELYANLAPDTPADWSTPYRSQAESRVNEVFLRAATHYRASGEQGLPELIQQGLDEAQAQLETVMGRNVFVRRRQ
jgi:arabinosaccharide transport system substrate-binding protein